MHPGPINRGVEIDSDVADGSAQRHSRTGYQLGSPCAWPFFISAAGGVGLSSLKIASLSPTAESSIPPNKRDEVADLWIADGVVADRSIAASQHPKAELIRRSRSCRGAGSDRYARALSGAWPGA